MGSQISALPSFFIPSPSLSISFLSSRNFGPLHLYQGLEAKLLQTVVAAGFMFLTYEQMARAVMRAFGVDRGAKGN